MNTQDIFQPGLVIRHKESGCIVKVLRPGHVPTPNFKAVVLSAGNDNSHFSGEERCDWLKKAGWELNPEPAPKLNTWRKVFEAAFARTGDTFFTLFSEGSIPQLIFIRFDEEFYKSYDSELHQGGFPEAINFTIRGNRHTYSSQRMEGYEFIVRGDFDSPSLFVYVGHGWPKIPPTKPLDNPTPLGITREEVETLIAKQGKIAELGSRRNYHMSEAIKVMKQMLDLQGDYNNGD